MACGRILHVSTTQIGLEYSPIGQTKGNRPDVLVTLYPFHSLKSNCVEKFDKSSFFRRITRVITHVNFDKFSYEYDIALLKMVTKVDFQPNIIPICLPVS